MDFGFNIHSFNNLQETLKTHDVIYSFSLTQILNPALELAYVKQSP